MATITPVSVGAAAHADNASVVPSMPAGIVAGDLLVLVAAIRNTAAFVNSVTNPGGWALLGNFGEHLRVYGLIWNGTDGAPTCAFVGGSAGDTCSAQMAAFRGAAPIADSSALLTNSSAVNIAYPGLTPGRQGTLAIVGGWKQDDWTSVAALAGMTELGEPSSVLGNDQGLVWDYVIQTTAVAVTAGSFTVTGGVSAVSKGYVLAIEPLPTLTITPQDVYPPRNLLSVTDLAIGDAVTLYRVVSGLRTAVRAGVTAAATDSSFVVVDAELPFGVPVSYVATVNGVDYTSASVTYVLPGGKVALSDAITGQSAEVRIRAFPTRDFTRDSSVFTAGGRNVAVLGSLTGFTGTIELYAETTSIRDNIYALLATATQGVIQVRQPGGYDGIDCYIAVLSVPENRFSQDGTDERRWVSLDAVEVGGWASSLEAGGYTLQDLADLYAGLTLADIAADFPTLLAIALADLS